jgi:ring-1,2-phenylacetyl-CoA epoxidase subunit PaaE
MPRFHPLTVTDVQKDTRDAIVVTLRPEDPALFAHVQGQYLTFRHNVDGQQLRRSYSICSPPHENTLQIAIKQVSGGAFSGWANRELRPGMVLQSLRPAGNFHTKLTPDTAKHYLFFAAGSGITPIMATLKTVLFCEPHSRVTLIYANRGVHTIMFREQLNDLKNQFMQRFSVAHVLSGDAQGADLFSGRIDRAKIDAFCAGWLDVSRIDWVFICGPQALSNDIVDGLQDHGIDRNRIKCELFGSVTNGDACRVVLGGGRDAAAEGAAQSVAKRAAQSVAQSVVQSEVKRVAQITLDGTTRQIPVQAGQTVLQAALDHQIDAPFSCRAGVCSTCRCKVLRGDVDMATNHALEDYEVAQGYVLSCQAIVASDEVVVDYDQ